jgi:hypothetical protein
MTGFEFSALLIGGLVFLWIIWATLHRLDMDSHSTPRAWLLPLSACTLLVAWTLWCILDEGLLAVFPAISASAWANQIWFDLLLAVSIALSFLVPEARRLGMKPLPWVFLVLTTGSIGLLAMTARILYLRAQACK